MKLNWKTLSVATVAGALVLTAAALAFSQGPQGPPRGGGGPTSSGTDLAHPMDRQVVRRDNVAALRERGQVYPSSSPP